MEAHEFLTHSVDLEPVIEEGPSLSQSHSQPFIHDQSSSALSEAQSQEYVKVHQGSEHKQEDVYFYVRDPQASGKLSEHNLATSKQLISHIRPLCQTPPHHSSSPVVSLMAEEELYYQVPHEEEQEQVPHEEG